MYRAWSALLTTMFVGIACGPSSPSSEVLTTTDTSSTQDSTQSESTSEDPSSGSSTEPETETETEPAPETETETGDESSLTFVPDDDLISFPAPCEMIAPGDCLQGEKCVPGYVQGVLTSVCRPVEGDGAPGDACEVDDDSHDTCGADSWCFLDECRAYCSGSRDEPTCADPDYLCMTSNNHVYVGCTPRCDPLLTDCAEGESCVLTGSYPSPSTFTCIPHVDPPNELHEDCYYINSCAPGLFCASGQSVPGCVSPSCCTDLCDLSNPDEMCSSPEASCVTLWDDMPLEGHEDVGVCILPLP